MITPSAAVSHLPAPPPSQGRARTADPRASLLLEAAPRLLREPSARAARANGRSAGCGRPRSSPPTCGLPPARAGPAGGPGPPLHLPNQTLPHCEREDRRSPRSCRRGKIRKHSVCCVFLGFVFLPKKITPFVFAQKSQGGHLLLGAEMVCQRAFLKGGFCSLSSLTRYIFNIKNTIFNWLWISVLLALLDITEKHISTEQLV